MLDGIAESKEKEPVCMELELDSLMEAESKTDMVMAKKDHDSLLAYLLSRLNSEQHTRTARIQRYARVDQMVSTWQKLSPEDSKREYREEINGKLQAIPMNLPIAQAHIDDAVAFYSEIFAPIGGNFYATPGKFKDSEAMKALIEIMQADTQQSQYYAQVTAVMRSLNKYNFGGFHVVWQDGIQGAAGAASQSGNRVEALDVYNFMYDQTVKDVSKFHLNGEWCAQFKQVNRLWLIRQKLKGGTMNIGEILDATEVEGNYGLGQKGMTAKYYKNPPASTQLNEDGSDTRTGEGAQADVDWDSFGLGLGKDNEVPISGHEATHMYCWINPNQFGLSEKNIDSLQLWQFTIVNAKWIISASHVEEASEIPIYISRLNQDEMAAAARSIAEHLRPFQRFISFLVNTHVEGVRSNIWGLKALDPAMFDVSALKNGETSGILVSKIPNRDVRTGFMNLKNESDTRSNISDAGSILELMKQFFPNQALPSQVAGIDRAVTSQVTAVMQGAMRKLHMMVRLIDSSLMQPVRTAQYRNIALYDPDKAKLKGITEETVAALLNSGLGQIGREASAEAIRTLIFALIQNPDSAQQYDLPALYTLWSRLLNIGTDLGEFVKAAPPMNPGAGTVSDQGAAGAIPPQVAPTQGPVA